MSTELSIKISIADDHKIFRDGIRMALKDKDYLKILWEAEDGKDLMHKMQLKKPDVLLMDIRMPEMDGVEATAVIRKDARYNRLPIVAMTANALPTDKAACFAAGMQDHIAKPFSVAEVVQKTLHYCGVQQSNDLPQRPSASFDSATMAFCQQHQIELEQACARLGSSTDLYLKVLQQFIKDLQQAQTTLRQTKIAQTDARILFHSLKGSAATVGFSILAEHAASEEARLNTAEVQVNGDITLTFKLLEDSQNKASELLTLLQAQKATDENTIAMPQAELRRQLNLLMHYLTSANMQALATFRALLPTLQQQDPQLAEQLDNAISALAFDTAAAISAL